MRQSSENISQSQQQIINDEILASQLQVEEQENRRLEELDERSKNQEEVNKETADKKRLEILKARKEDIIIRMDKSDYNAQLERELENIEKQIEEITKALLKDKDKLNSESMVGEDELSQAIDLSTMIFSKEEGDKENLTSSTTEFKLSRLHNQINTEYAAVLSSILPKIHMRSKVYAESMLQVPQEATDLVPNLWRSS
ncbi:hypothetical protein H1Q59_08495 [Holosporaceae bacterium 'Namur']|nr:hypothetical protein [Holosporaceae bacterium 'Namur']